MLRIDFATPDVASFVLRRYDHSSCQFCIALKHGVYFRGSLDGEYRSRNVAKVTKPMRLHKFAPYIRSLRLNESFSNAESNSGAYRLFNHPSASDNPLEQLVKPIPTRNSQKNR